MKIRLLPSQREFEQPPHESLLEAALRAGIALDYGCHSGTCGNCAARIVSGKVERIMHSDYVFSEAEQAQGFILLCCHSAIDDIVLEVHAATGAAEVPLQSMDVRVRKVESLTPDTLLLHLRTSRSRTLRFLAGQRARLTFSGGLSRVLAIASCPCDSLNLQFHIHARDAELFARVQRLASADTLNLEGPLGSFIFDEQSARPTVFIAFGGGFAPIKSLLEHALSLDREQSVRVYWAAHANGHYLQNYGRALADALDNVVYVPLTLDVNDPDTNLKSLQAILVDIPQNENYDVYLAARHNVAALARALFQDHAPNVRLFVDEIESADAE